MIIEGSRSKFNFYFHDFKNEEQFDCLLRNLGLSEEEAQETELIEVEIKLLHSKRLVQNN